MVYSKIKSLSFISGDKESVHRQLAWQLTVGILPITNYTHVDTAIGVDIMLRGTGEMTMIYYSGVDNTLINVSYLLPRHIYRLGLNYLLLFMYFRQQRWIFRHKSLSLFSFDLRSIIYKYSILVRNDISLLNGPL